MNSDLRLLSKRLVECAGTALNCAGCAIDNAVQAFLLAFAVAFSAVGWLFAWMACRYESRQLDKRIRRVEERLMNAIRECDPPPPASPPKGIVRSSTVNCVLPILALPLISGISNFRLIAGLIFAALAICAFLFAVSMCMAAKIGDRMLERDALIPTPGAPSNEADTDELAFRCERFKQHPEKEYLR